VTNANFITVKTEGSILPADLLQRIADGNLDGLLPFQRRIELEDGTSYPPKRLQLIRRYGLYASRTKGRWEDIPWVGKRVPDGRKAAHHHHAVTEDLDYEPLSDGGEVVNVKATNAPGCGSLRRSTRAICSCVRSAVQK
jgi:hypothetical protein